MAIVNKPQEAFDFLEKYINDITLKLDNTYNKPKPLISYPDPECDIFKYGLEYLSDQAKYSNYFRWDINKTSLDSIKKRFDSLNDILDKYQESLKSTQAINAEIVKHNIEVKEKIKSIMKSIGIPDSYREVDTKSRSRNTKYIEKRAGYLDDISRNIPIGDSLYRTLSDKIALNKVEIKKWYDSSIKIIADKEKQETEALKKQEKEKLIAVIKVKYNIPFEYSDYDVLNYLIDKNKYLKLAHFLEKNRNDWNDGYHYAEYGLNSFIVESDQDQKIYEDINNCIANWDGDGRCFRDCTWNYNTIFGLVDTEFLEDYYKVRSYEDDV